MLFHQMIVYIDWKFMMILYKREIIYIKKKVTLNCLVLQV